ncbi:2-hydroxyacyl-CoA dehydratase, partial [Clostridium aestuarii]|nr:2-hydroxyacyl-CoA dehydratase [Clostridium aestuarii]
MSRIESIINELAVISNNPKKAMEDYKKETGKGAVGVMPVYAPEEMIHAAGFLPVGIWG